METSVVDIANPLVIVRAADVGVVRTARLVLDDEFLG